MKISLPSLEFLRCAGISCLLLGLPVAGHAQNAPRESSDVTVMNPFTVSGERAVEWNSQATLSGSRTATALLDTPQNISIFTEEFIKDTGATNLIDLLAYGASGMTQRTDYREDLMVRGFRTMPLRDGLSFGTYASMSTLYDIDRVEILKGPTAIVYSNYTTLGGTLNYVTKRPTSTSKGDASFVAGSFGTWGANATQSGPLSADKRVTYRVTAGFQEMGGYMGDEFINQRMISAGVDWVANDKLTVRFDAGVTYQLNHDFFRAFIDPISRNLSEVSRNLLSTAADFAYVRNLSERFRMDATYQVLPELNLRLMGNMYGINYDYSLAQPFQGLKAAEAPNYRTIVQRYLRFSLENRTNDIQFDATWKRDFGPVENRLNAGYAFNFTDTYQAPLYTAALPDFVIGQRYNPAVPAPSTWSVVAGASTARNGGWTTYIQDSASLLNGKVIGVAGVRYISDDATAAVGKTASVPQVGAVVKILPTISVYGSYSESYTPLTGVDLIGRPLVDTVGKSQEVGFKFNALNERLFGTVTYFDISNDPVMTPGQVINPNTGLLVTGNVQTGKQTNKGWEFDGGWAQPIGRDLLSLYGTFYSADPLSERNVQPVLAPKTKNSLFIKYAFGENALKGAYFGGGYVHTGSSPGVGFPNQPANTQYNAMAGFAWPRWKLSLNVTNLTDERVIVGSAAVFSANVARPRYFTATLSTSW